MSQQKNLNDETFVSALQEVNEQQRQALNSDQALQNSLNVARVAAVAKLNKKPFSFSIPVWGSAVAASIILAALIYPLTPDNTMLEPIDPIWFDDDLNLVLQLDIASFELESEALSSEAFLLIEGDNS